ncbi:MAG: aminomethyltransferase family protein [Chloroflexi bacterium]|nr:aminomethyl transferase family protein [Chloroflexota bacterium]MCH8350036.1 aminomethyl transferase family protein [Chloroflexota bacterium]MCI0779952.1 aminomethyltransferase family protein [Chloroflexota bacterium]MCI0784753.1 aminomethyltransferase family protein [Chloroflexota bacterium]MCI0792136.1 aminomethyltransferase family protein [Chloroflexota bacterium]
MTLQRSALHSLIAGSGARLLESDGWELPAAYTDVAAEYSAVTTGAGLYDASHWGRLKATGADGLDLLNRLSTNKVVDLAPGEAAPTILTTDRGRIVDLISVVNMGGYVMLITSPGTQQTVIDYLDKYTIMEDLTVEDVTGETTMLAVLGPDSRSALEAAAAVSLSGVSPYHTVSAHIAQQQVQIIDHPLGELPCYHLLLGQESAADVWQHLLDTGIKPVGKEAYETVRVQYAVPAHGRELGEPYNPLEAGLIGSIDFAKGCYIGQEVIARLDTYQKVQKYLVRLRFSDGAQVEEGTPLSTAGQNVGTVTSVTVLPTTGSVIGLGYVRKNNATVGNRLELADAGDSWAEIEDIPLLFGPGQD